MTSNLKGIEPPLPTSTRTFPLPPGRTSSQTIQQPPRSRPCQTPSSIHNAPVRTSPRNSSQPPLKRQKLEHVSGSPPSSFAIGGSARHNGSEAVTNSQHWSGGAQSGKQSHVREQVCFPHRPGVRPPGTTQHRHPLAIERAARRDVVPVKAYVPEAPSCAPRYYQAGPADFFPWTGHHPEDLLNELTTKSGYFDKFPHSQHESNTARPSMWSSLKHKSGLQILSSLFVSALDQRQAHGTITASSTFKPPPRVTLTDTKREAWLRDLANPLIPLRRLSRTIPHGIRGKILLDHCLSKDIPTSRALWLAKCVGANEIRAFKRKGTGGIFTVGGEAKWIKDWTTNIEQFLDSIIATCGGPEWKAKINYGLRLAEHLYSEHLLDQDHYLDWLIRSIEASDLDSIPIWLLVQQIHQQELLQYRQRGRRLAGAVSGQLYHVSALNLGPNRNINVLTSLEANLPMNRELYGSVLHQLVQLSRSILIAAPACFLLQDNWDQCKNTLEGFLIDQDDEQLQMCFENLSRRNLNLGSHSLRRNRQLSSSLGRRVIGLLDTLSIKPNFGKVAGACLRLADNSDRLVRTCIEWSASIYRHGHFRTYAAARLLRLWNKQGVELQRPIFDLLASNPDAEGLNRQDLYRLLAGLMSSKNLSVGKYLQWLMARGTLQGRHKLGADCPCDVGLLFELPLHGLPSHVLNLRQTLVSSTLEGSSDQESRVIATTKAEIAEQLPGLFRPINASKNTHELTDHSVYLSQSARSDVARWMRQNLISRLTTRTKSNAYDDDNQQINEPSSYTGSFVTLAEFRTVRRVLEGVGDYAILADVLNLLSDQVGGQTLTAMTDTVNYHFDVFNAIGAANGLFQKLSHNVELDGQDLEEAALESLIDLGSRLSDTDQAIRRLRKELSARAPKPSAAVCSPISDTMVEALQSTEPTFADEMDQMLASGTSIDKQNLTRVFGTIISHLEKSFDESSHLIVRFSQLLARLREFGPKLFDALLDNWIQIWLEAERSRDFLISLAPMICSKVSSLGTILASVNRVMATTGVDQCVKLALDTLALVLGAISEKMTVVEYRSYRLLDQLQSLVRTSPISILTIISCAVNACDSNDPSTQKRAKVLFQSTAVKDLAHTLLLHQSELASMSSPNMVDFYLNPAMQRAIGRVRHLNEPSDTLSLAPRDRIMSILKNISEFNIFLAYLELKAVLGSSTNASEDPSIALSEIMIERARLSVDGHVDLLAYIVSELSADQAIPVRHRAESEVLAWAVGDSKATSVGRIEPILALMAIVEASAFCVPAAETWPLLEKLVEALANLLPTLQPDSGLAKSAAGLHQGLQRVEVLLRLLVVHRSGIQHPKSSQPLLFHLLMSLSLLLIHPLLTSSSTLSNYIFDVLTLLSDSLPDETRSRCIRSLRDHHRIRDPRLRFIFGYSDTVESEWLQLITKPPSMADLRLEGATTIHSKPYPLRKWETMQDATPVATENDTSLSLTLFGSRKSVL